MKIAKRITFVLITLMSITAGIPKITRIPDEMEFFQAAGLGVVSLVLLGVLQIIGGALLILNKTRMLGATVATVGFLASTVVLLLAGKTVFAVVSTIPVGLAILIVIDQGSRMDPYKFWDRIAKRYARQAIANEPVYQKKLQVTREYFRPDVEVLEFGCGTGSTAIAHGPHVKHIQAIDVSSKMIEIAQRKAEENNVENVTFARSTIEEFCVDDQSLDAVLGLSILHLLENRDGVIAKIYKMLKPGGVFVTSTMCMGGTMRVPRVIVPIGRFFGLLPLVRWFTAEELKASFVQAGFEIDHQWQPGKGKAVFIVAKKAA